MMDILPALLVIVIVFSLWLVNAMLFRIDRLEAKGNVEGAYRFAQRYLQFVMRTGIWRVRQFLIIGINLRLSRLAEKRGDIALAIDYAKQSIAIERNPSVRSMVLQRIAVLLRKLDQTEAARQIENEAVALAAQSPRKKGLFFTHYVVPVAPEVQQSALLIQLGHFRSAIALIDECLPGANPVSAIYLRRQRAAALAFQGRYDEAIANQDTLDESFAQLDKEKRAYCGYTLSMSWSFKPKDRHDLYIVETLLFIGIRLRAGHIGAATEQWEKLAGKKTSPTVYHYYVAMNAWLCAALGNDEKARQLLQEAEKTYATQSWDDFTKLACGSTMAQAYVQIRDYTSAVRILEGMIEHVPYPAHQTSYRTLLADCYTKREQNEAAEKLYTQIVAAGFEEAAFTAHARAQLQRLREAESPIPLTVTVGA